MQFENEDKLADDKHDDRSIEMQSVLDMDDDGCIKDII